LHYALQWFLKIYVSSGSVATPFKCGEIFSNHAIANCPQYVPVKEFWKLVNIWWRYGKWQSGTFFGMQCINQMMCAILVPLPVNYYLRQYLHFQIKICKNCFRR